MGIKKINWPIRKGCMRCRAPLKSSKERIIRTCDGCAKGALDGFQDMSEGKFKSGFKKVVSAGGLDETQEAVVKSTVTNAMSKKRKKIEKKVLKECRKKGLSEDDAKEQLKRLEEFAKD